MAQKPRKQYPIFQGFASYKGQQEEEKQEEADEVPDVDTFTDVSHKMRISKRNRSKPTEM